MEMLLHLQGDSGCVCRAGSRGALLLQGSGVLRGGILAVKGIFPSLLAQGEGLVKGKGAGYLLAVVFTAGKQNPVGGFVTSCELFSYAHRAAWLDAGKPWRPAGDVQEAFQQEEENEAAGFQVDFVPGSGETSQKMLLQAGYTKQLHCWQSLPVHCNPHFCFFLVSIVCVIG